MHHRVNMGYQPKAGGFDPDIYFPNQPGENSLTVKGSSIIQLRL